MSEKKNSRVLSFLKSNLYYLLIGVALITIVTVTALVIVNNGKNKPNVAEKPPIESSDPDDSSKEPGSQGDKPDKPDESGDKDPDKPDEPDKPSQGGDDPVDQKITFTLPVKNATISKEYTSSTVVFNKTLGVYTGHMGVDFTADAGTDVVCVYAGKIESITTSYLQGTTVTVDHGNGLKSVYNSIEVKEGLAEGKTLSAGDVIGTVSDNNRQEYKDGAHLHFEVTENGIKTDPNKYLKSA